MLYVIMYSTLVSQYPHMKTLRVNCNNSFLWCKLLIFSKHSSNLETLPISKDQTETEILPKEPWRYLCNVLSWEASSSDSPTKKQSSQPEK